MAPEGGSRCPSPARSSRRAGAVDGSMSALSRGRGLLRTLGGVGCDGGAQLSGEAVAEAYLYVQPHNGSIDMPLAFFKMPAAFKRGRRNPGRVSEGAEVVAMPQSQPGETDTLSSKCPR